MGAGGIFQVYHYPTEQSRLEKEYGIGLIACSNRVFVTQKHNVRVHCTIPTKKDGLKDAAKGSGGGRGRQSLWLQE